MGNIKKIDIKNRTHFLFNNMINIKNFDSDLLKIAKESYKSIHIYCIGYITMKVLGYVNIHTVNPLYFIIDKADGYIEEINGNKFLTLVSTGTNRNINNIYRTMEEN